MCVHLHLNMQALYLQNAHTPNAFLQGAIFWDWTKDAVDVPAAVPVQLQVEPDLLAAALEAKGVSSSKPVVVRQAACLQ